MHPLNRPHQQDTYDRIINSKAKHIIIQAPTGSGKSAWAAQCAHDGNTALVLTRTKSLQQQYRDNYGFTVLYGKSNYDCLNFYSEQISVNGIVECHRSWQRLYADLCSVDKETYQQCCSLQCPYPLAINDFLDSHHRSLNYSKYMLERKLADGCDYLFLDEAHELSDLVTDHSGIVIPFSGRLERYIDPIEIDLPQPVAYEEGKQWLIDLINSLASKKPKHPNNGGDKREWRWHKRMTERVGITLNMMTLEPDCWFVFADDVKFTCKPLTARFHFQKLFDQVPKIVMMSATVGKIDNFVRELGIDDYEYIEVPNTWPAPLRIIKDLQGPKMTWRSDENDKQRHAELIANAILDCPREWSGIIHTPSKALSYDLANRLTYLLDDTVWTPDDIGTEQQLSNWQEFYRYERGAIGCSWSFWEGVDLGDQNINIVAKVPYTNFADSYDEARFHFDKIAGLQRVANKTVQGLGRTRRGRENDYGDNGLVAIADGNWKRIRGYMSDDVLDAIK